MPNQTKSTRSALLWMYARIFIHIICIYYEREGTSTKKLYARWILYELFDFNAFHLDEIGEVEIPKETTSLKK